MVDEQGRAEDLPEIYKDVLFFGSTVVTTATGPSVHVGGFLWVLRVSLSYLLAARRLISATDPDHLGEVVLPIAYLQRHAFEVAVKDLIDGAYEIHCDRRWLARLGADPMAERPDCREAGRHHNLPRLIDELEPALAAIDEGPSPPQLRSLAAALWRIENEHPDRWRYAKVRETRHSRTTRSFATPTEVPIAETQQALEDLFAQHLWCPDFDRACQADAPIWGRLGVEHEGLVHAIERVFDEAGRPL